MIAENFKRAILEIFVKFTENRICWTPLYIVTDCTPTTSSKHVTERLRPIYYTVNLTKFFRTAVLYNICEWRLPSKCVLLQNIIRVSLLLALNIIQTLFSISSVDFEQVIICWEYHNKFGTADSSQIPHCTKNEEILNGKLHFLCSAR